MIVMPYRHPTASIHEIVKVSEAFFTGQTVAANKLFQRLRSTHNARAVTGRIKNL